MKRRFISFLTTISCTICVMTSVFWVRSYWVSDHLSRIDENGCDLGSFRGHMRLLIGGTSVHDGKVGLDSDVVLSAFGIHGGPGIPHAKIGWQYVGIPSDDWVAEMYWTVKYSFDQSRMTWLGFSFVRSGGGSLDYDAVWPQTAPFLWLGSFWQVIAPDWAIVTLAAILPLLWSYRTWRRRRLRMLGCCAKCGYDLRATPQRCPECGTDKARSNAGVVTSVTTISRYSPYQPLAQQPKTRKRKVRVIPPISPETSHDTAWPDHTSPDSERE